MPVMPGAMPSTDGSNGPPPYSYENSQQRRPQQRRPQQQNPQQRQTYSRGYGPQPTERTPMLPRQSDTGLESGVSSSPPTTRHIWIFKLPSLPGLLALLVACYFGYNLNPYINSRYYEMTRQRWALEKAEHQALEAVWEEKRTRHEEQERQRRDDEIKKRDGISWEGLAAARCSRYATREYTAVLANVPLGFDALEECRKKTVNIHGRDLLPSRCEDRGVCGRVTGHWYVEFEEPGCVTWWHRFDDKGCYSSGVRLYHSKLENLEDYDLWAVMCSTTPREVNGVHYDGPTSCADFGHGPWGVWHIPDASCP